MAGRNYAGWEAYKPGQTPAKRSKYRAEPTEVGGIRFASKKEADRYRALLIEQQAGAITGLELQPQFPLHAVDPNGVRIVIARYIGDFRYVRDGRTVIEDAKGMRTPVYVLKRAHVEAEYGIEILET